MNRYDSSNFDNEQKPPTDIPKVAELPQEGLLQIVWRRYWGVLLAETIRFSSGVNLVYRLDDCDINND